jgi:FAD/FMN-containing dehydrogenase
MIDSSHLDQLRAIVGLGGLVEDPSLMRSYEIGARYDEGRAAFVVRPETTQQVSALMSYAVKHGIRLIPQSGNTGLVGGSTPDASGSQGVVSLDRLTTPLTIDADNRTVEVAAGVRLSALNGALAPYGFFLPVDLGADPMVGGMVATNTGGARFLRYGSMRRQVLGLEVVLPDADGTILDLASGLRKDNSRVDLKQLFIGTSGAFGIVTKVVMEVQRLPGQTATALVVPESDESVPLLLQYLEERCGEYLTAFEGMSGNAMERALGHVKHLRNPFAHGTIPAYAILVELTRSWAPREGEMDLPSFLESVLVDAFEGEPALLSDALVGRSEDLWSIRHALSEGLKASGYVIAFDLSLRRSDLARFRRDIIGRLAETFPELAVCDFGHIADGGVHFNLVHSERPDAAYIGRVRDQVLDLVVTRYGGSFSGEHGLGRSNQALYDHYTPALVQALSASVQRAIGAAAIGNARLAPEHTYCGNAIDTRSSLRVATSASEEPVG